MKTIPGVREGIEQKQYAEAEQEIVRVAKGARRGIGADRISREDAGADRGEQAAR